MVIRFPCSGHSGMYFCTSSSKETCPRLASSRMLIAVNCLDMEAAGKTVAGVMCIPHSRAAMPYPPSYTTVPFWLTAKLQPGELEVFHSANNASILALNFECEALSKRELRLCADAVDPAKDITTAPAIMSEHAELASLFTIPTYLNSVASRLLKSRVSYPRHKQFCARLVCSHRTPSGPRVCLLVPTKRAPLSLQTLGKARRLPPHSSTQSKSGFRVPPQAAHPDTHRASRENDHGLRSSNHRR